MRVRLLLPLLVAAFVLAGAASARRAGLRDVHPCTEAGFTGATLDVPLDRSHPRGDAAAPLAGRAAQLRAAVARIPAAKLYPFDARTASVQSRAVSDVGRRAGAVPARPVGESFAAGSRDDMLRFCGSAERAKGEERMIGSRVAWVVAIGAAALGLSASSGAAGTSSGSAGASSTTDCLAHVVGGLSADDSDWADYYTPGCTGHDEPELDPVSSVPGSAQNITWRVALPAGGTSSVPSVGPTFWFGGTVKDTNPAKLGGEGFLEMQFYPDSFTKKCTPNGNFIVKHEVGVYTVCSPVWTLVQKQSGKITEPAAFNGMLTNASRTGPFVMHGRDIVDIHIWAPSPNAPYDEQVADETSGETSGVLTLVSPGDGPLTPQFSTNEIGNALDWGTVWDTPMAFVYEIGHSDIFGPQNGALCLPGQTDCGSFNRANWAGQQPIRIFGATFGDGSHPQHWAVVSDTGGKAEVLGNSFVGPTDCTGYGGPYCIYPWFSWDGQAFNYGVDYPDTVDNFGRVNQFAKTEKCPEDGVFAGPTYCDTIIR